MAQDTGFVAQEGDSIAQFGNDLGGASSQQSADEALLELYKQNIGKMILTGLTLAGRNVGQPDRAMSQLWSSAWDEATAYMDDLMAEQQAASDNFRSIIDNAYNRQPQDQELGGQYDPLAADTTRGELGGQFAAQPGQAPKYPGSEKQQLGKDWYTNTLPGINDMTAKVWDFYRKKISFDIGDLNVDQARRGSGSRGPTPQQIRDSFDIDKLTREATNIWRTQLLTDDVDARPMARAYVDAMVATKGLKKIDFKEFITKKAEATDRFASIYVTKPPSMSASQYLLPYMQAAVQATGPGKAAGVAIEGAQFGSDAATFSARLKRTDAATSSSSFINQLQGRLSEMNKLFKG